MKLKIKIIDDNKKFSLIIINNRKIIMTVSTNDMIPSWDSLS